MIVTLIIVCEIGFWVLLTAGLAARYLLKLPRTGAALLLCEPLLEVLLLVVAAVDLKNGADPSWRHGLAAVYIGFTVGHGHRTVKWLDGHAAHRFGGAPPPPKPPRYGMARARHEGAIWLGTAVAAVIASGLLFLAILYVGGDGDTDGLRETIQAVWRAAGIHGLIALSYAIWPKKDPGRGPAPEGRAGGLAAGDADRGPAGDADRGPAGGADRDSAAGGRDVRSAVPARDPEHVPDFLVRGARKDEEQI